jgi:fused signal recognition particle receptor
MALFGKFFRRKAAPDAPPEPAGEAPAPVRETHAELLPAELLVEPPPDALIEAAPDAPEARRGFLSRLRDGLSRSAAKLSDGIGAIFARRVLDEAALEDLSDLLITTDIGVQATERIIDNFRNTSFGREVTDTEIREALAREIAAMLAPVAVPLVPDPSRAPFVVLVVGVNGSGKTTTIAKLAALWGGQGPSGLGLRCMLCAGDTFRAAAVEQLKVWGARTGAPVIAGGPGADAPGLAFEALAEAKRLGADVLLIDTAGRLHNKAELMAELGKMIRVLQKQDASAPHAVLLVLDATTGQNAVQQTYTFSEMTQVTGLVVTKLDGSAKGGVVVALASAFGLPVHAVGVGERAEDLRPFDAEAFARSLVGVATPAEL